MTHRCDILVVGGGPAGSSCAWALRRAGADVTVLDGAQFPRDKICAGWITPPVLRHLELDPDEYAATGLTIQPMTGFRTGIVDRAPVDTLYETVVSYGIRRCEFDNYLLGRAHARVLGGTPLRSLRRTGDTWIVNDEIEAKTVIGAGGHFCPVAKFVRRGHRVSGLVVAQEVELRLPDPGACRVSGVLPELYFCPDLEGYGWCVRKGAYINVGLGRRDGAAFPAQVARFVRWLEETGRVPPLVARARWRGHAYLLIGSVTTPVVADDMMLIGDSAGLAYAESGEGIRTAVESGLLAARTLIGARSRRREDLMPYEQAVRSQASPGLSAFVPRSIVRPLGRWLLGNATFTRRVVLDRWFLHSTPSAPAVLDKAA